MLYRVIVDAINLLSKSVLYVVYGVHEFNGIKNLIRDMIMTLFPVPLPGLFSSFIISFIIISVKAVELSYVPLYHAVYSLYGAFFGIFHTLMSIFSVRQH